MDSSIPARKKASKLFAAGIAGANSQLQQIDRQDGALSLNVGARLAAYGLTTCIHWFGGQ